jgi:8-amino-7-oxononanoate synthase
LGFSPTVHAKSLLNALGFSPEQPANSPIKPMTVNYLPGRIIWHDGRELLFFSGTAYLGMAHNPDFRALLLDAMGRYGTTFGSSRNGNLQLAIYDEAEAHLAGWVGAEAALTVSSGMLAGQAVVQWLLAGQMNDPHQARFLYAPGTHPALWHEPTVTLPNHLSFSAWTDWLLNQPPQPMVILTNSLDSIRSEVYDFHWLAHLPTDYPITLVVDDSHGLGVTGPDGRGIWPALAHRLANVRVIVTASLAKGVGLRGGVILADTETIASIRQTAYFAGSSPMSPAELAAFVRADALYAEARARLTRNVALAETWLRPTDLFRQASGYPVFFTEHEDLYPTLLDRGIFVYSFAYPTPDDPRNTRIIISAVHEPADIEQLGQQVRSLAPTLVRLSTNADS